jgi:hypothetical protein
MSRAAPPVILAALACTALLAVPAAATGAANPDDLQLPAAARVGVVNLLDAEVTHFHASRQIENSFLKTYPVTWQVNGMLLNAVRERLVQMGLVAVPVAPSDELSHARENCLLNATLVKALPKGCDRPFAHLAAGERLDALIVLGPGRNDAAHAGSARHRDLPEYLRGWCFVTGKGSADAAPTLLNLTELLLLGPDGGTLRLVHREWGGEGGSWSGYRTPPDLKAMPNVLLDEAQPLFAADLQRQVDGLFAHLQVAHQSN